MLDSDDWIPWLGLIVVVVVIFVLGIYHVIPDTDITITIPIPGWFWAVGVLLLGILTLAGAERLRG